MLLSFRISSSLASFTPAITLVEVGDLRGVGGVERDERAAAALEGRDHAEDVRVVEPDGGELDRVRRV